MRLLLDTHALLWWWTDDGRLSATARTAIAAEANEVYVSAASAWEVATKSRLGAAANAAHGAVELVSGAGLHDEWLRSVRGSPLILCDMARLPRPSRYRRTARRRHTPATSLRRFTSAP